MGIHPPRSDSATNGLSIRGKAGDWVAPLGGTPTGTPTLNDGRIYVVPWHLPSGRGIDQVAIAVTGAGAGGTLLRFMAFADDDGWPGTLVGDYGTAAGDAVASITKAVTVAHRSLVWIGVGAFGGSPAVRGLQKAGGHTVVAAAGTSLVDNEYRFPIVMSGYGGVAPGTWPVSRGSALGLNTFTINMAARLS